MKRASQGPGRRAHRNRMAGALGTQLVRAHKPQPWGLRNDLETQAQAQWAGIWRELAELLPER